MSNSTKAHFTLPVRWTIEYTKEVGKALPKILGEVLTELGFRVEVNHQQANGVDLEIFLGDNLVLVAEVVNWSIRSRLTDKRKNCYIRNLSKHNCSKVFIYTVPLSNLNGFTENGIHLLELGYQILPENYYNYFLELGQVTRRKIDSDSVRRDIRSKILGYVVSNLSHKYFKICDFIDTCSWNFVHYHFVSWL